jgi:hypothetical protein
MQKHLKNGQKASKTPQNHLKIVKKCIKPSKMHKKASKIHKTPQESIKSVKKRQKPLLSLFLAVFFPLRAPKLHG